MLLFAGFFLVFFVTIKYTQLVAYNAFIQKYNNLMFSINYIHLSLKNPV